MRWGARTHMMQRIRDYLPSKAGVWIALGLSLLPIYLAWGYVQNYGRAYPVNDQWLDSLDIAVATHDDTLTLDMITREYYGHRAIFANTLTVAVSWLTDWDTHYELYVILGLAVLRWILLLLIMRALVPRMATLALVPFSVLVFSTYQYLIWLSGIYSVWHFVSLFGLAAIWILVQFPVGWRALIGALVCGVLAAFSQGSGLVVLPVIAVTLWFYGYRKPQYYLVWGLGLALTLWLYVSGSSIGVGGDTTATSSTINFSDPQVFIRFVLAFLGNPFTHNLDTDFPIYVGAIGIALFIANGIYLWRQSTRMLAPWLTLTGFANATAITIYLTRYQPERFIYAIEQRYVLPSTNLWLAVVGCGLLVWWWHQQKPSRYGSILLTVNLLALVIGSGWFIRANLWNMQATANRYGHVIGYQFEPPDVLCLQNLPLARNFDCLLESAATGDASEDDIYRLAYYDLSIYNGQSVQNLLPPAYQADDQILLDTPNPWMNAYLEKWWLGETPAESVHHLSGQAVEPHPVPITLLTDVGTLDLGESSLWYVLVQGREESGQQITEQLIERGYYPTVYPISNTPYADTVTIIRFEPLPDLLDDPIVFGETFSLLTWQIEPEPQACTVVTLQSWWTVEAEANFNAGMRWVLSDDSGTWLNDSASGLSPVPTQLWQVGQYYLDERQIQMPCDLSADTYRWQLAVFDPATNENIPVAASDQTTDDNQLILQTFSIADG